MKKKLLAICTFLSLLPFGKSYAEEAHRQEEPSVSVDARQRTWQPRQTRVQKQATPSMTVLTSARGCEVDEGFFVTGEFLWWKASDDSINWTVTVTETLLGVSSNFGFTHYVDPNWKPAFRLGMGWNTAHDNWDLYLNWTWYNNSTRENLTAPTSSEPLMGQIGLAALWAPSTQGGNRAANYRWRLRHNMFDIELGRKFFVSRKLALRPFGGVRGGWINRNLRVNYLNPEGSLSNPTTPASYIDQNNYWGIGPRFGTNSEWGLGAGFQIYADLAAALLYGQIFELNERSFETNASGELVLVSNMQQNEDIWRIIPNLQLFLGFGWGKCFIDQDLFLAFKLGWEVNQYWDLSSFMNAARSQIFRTEQFAYFSLQGLTAKVDFEF